MAVLIAQPAPAQQQNPIALRLSSTVTWDANVFRVPDSAPDPQAVLGISGKSDRITTTTLGLLFDKAYAQQRFTVNVNQAAIRYNRFSSLDREASDYRAAWLWQLTPRISGTLSADHQQSAIAFEDFVAGRRLVKTDTNNKRFTVDGTLFGGWHLLAGISRYDLKNSAAFAGIPSTAQTTEEYGLRYVAASQSSITATRRSTSGVYPAAEGSLDNLIDTRLKVRETELNATWIATARSTLTGRVTRTERRYDPFAQFNFSGVGGEIRYSWTPTARLAFSAAALRTHTPFFQSTGSAAAGSTHRVDDTITFGPGWRVSEKLSLNLTASRVVSDFPASGILAAGPSRRDTARYLSLGANWTVHRKVNLSATLRREERSSNIPGLDYQDTILGATATLTF
jgi:exopolysaccharide biosynthesis operon protein EpsL